MALGLRACFRLCTTHDCDHLRALYFVKSWARFLLRDLTTSDKSPIDLFHTRHTIMSQSYKKLSTFSLNHLFFTNFANKIGKIMDIKKSEFCISSPTVSKCPKDNKPEYAFIGRSNVGKSSLINMLCNHKGLAKTSSTPGKTLLINHFIVNNSWYLVDLPGYGFAKRSKSVQQKLEQMISGYILQREQLVNVFVLIDIRHDPQLIDREFIDWLGESNIPFSIVFTKADKLGPVKARQNATAWMEKLKDRWETLPPYFITSAEKKTGREEVLDYIDQINKSLEADN